VAEVEVEEAEVEKPFKPVKEA
jgi:hypothetical protein